jgi:hypothetical protein
VTDLESGLIVDSPAAVLLYRENGVHHFHMLLAEFLT